VPVAHHQPPPVLIPLTSVRGNIGGDLVFQRGGQHPPRPFPRDLI
jgi:hypothetical protein